VIALCTLYVGDEAQSLPGVMRCYDWNWGISFYPPLHSAFFNFHYRQKIQRSLSVTIGFSWGRGCRLPRNSLSKKGFSHLLSLIDEKRLHGHETGGVSLGYRQQFACKETKGIATENFRSAVHSSENCDQEECQNKRVHLKTL